MRKNIDYIIFVMLLAFTTFEFFFRADKLFIILAFLSIFIAIHQGLFQKNDISKSIIWSTVLLMWTIIQITFIVDTSITQLISMGITLLGSLSIALIIKDRFIKIFVSTIYYISIIAITVYALCLIPEVKDYIINTICPNFTSLNVESAVFEGGGKNFVIHNFASDGILESTGLMRNCGPFWEPGMFAVFLNISLFLNNLVEKQKLRHCNLVLILALISTFSTGGYLGGLLVLLSFFIIPKKNILITLISIMIFIFISQYVLSLEYVGEKLQGQIENVEVGSDISRFSAFITQMEMIKNSPILGGERISDYLTGDSKTLASGTLLPFVMYGIPIGLCYFLVMLTSITKLIKSKERNLLTAMMFFLTLLFLSFSQTILLSSWMVVMIFVGLNTSNKRYYGNKFQYRDSRFSI